MLRLKRIDKLLLSTLFENFLLIIFSGIGIFITVDFLDRIGPLTKNNAKLDQIINIEILQIPSILYLVIPLALLISTVVTVGRLSQTSQMVAFIGAGIHPLRILMPFVIIGALCSGSMWLLSERAVPYSLSRSDEIYNYEIRKGENKKANLWMRNRDTFMTIGVISPKDKKIEGITITSFDKSFRPVKRLDAENGQWLGKDLGWVLNNCFEMSVSGESQITKVLPLPITVNPQELFKLTSKSESRTSTDLIAEINKRKLSGVRYLDLQVDLLSKFSFPFIGIVVSLIGFRFGLLKVRTPSIIPAILYSVGLGFAYYILHSLSLSFGKAELLPSIYATWNANVLFTLLSLYLLRDEI